MACGNAVTSLAENGGDDSSAKIIARRPQNIRLFEGECSLRARRELRYADCGISRSYAQRGSNYRAVNRACWTGNARDRRSPIW